MDDPKAAALLAQLPGNAQSSLVANMALTVAALLREFAGGTAIVAVTVPGITSDNGTPMQVCIPVGDAAQARAMLPTIARAVETMETVQSAAREAAREAARDAAAAEKGN